MGGWLPVDNLARGQRERSLWLLQLRHLSFLYLKNIEKASKKCNSIWLGLQLILIQLFGFSGPTIENLQTEGFPIQATSIDRRTRFNLSSSLLVFVLACSGKSFLELRNNWFLYKKYSI